MNELFVGTGVALVTPFLLNKKIDFESLERIIKFVDIPEINYFSILRYLSFAFLKFQEVHIYLQGFYTYLELQKYQRLDFLKSLMKVN